MGASKGAGISVKVSTTVPDKRFKSCLHDSPEQRQEWTLACFQNKKCCAQSGVLVALRKHSIDNMLCAWYLSQAQTHN
jgi:hypothetical protein